jgi:hypothetical protein
VPSQHCFSLCGNGRRARCLPTVARSVSPITPSPDRHSVCHRPLRLCHANRQMPDLPTAPGR